MSTPDPKPVKTKKLPNPKLLPVAALALVVLALLFMATPLLRASSSFQRNRNFVTPGNGPSTSQRGVPGPGTGPQFFIGGGGGPQGQVSPGQGGTNLPVRRIGIGGGLLGGVARSIFYFVLLLVSLVAAIGMFMAKRWGQVFGIIMAVIYGLLGLVSLLPLLLTISFGVRNFFSLALGVVHVLLAVAVIFLASIPAKSVSIQAAASPPPAVL